MVTHRRLIRTAGTAACAVAAIVCTAAPGRAQDSSTYYTVTHASEFTINWKAFYDNGERMTAETHKELPHHLAIAYGTNPKQALDVYEPKEKGTGRPVFIFLHGGGMREGDRAQYGWVARPFARHGIVTIVASYRLTPAFHYPDQTEDAREILRWAFEHVKSYGGDPARLYIAGHSAGAILSASVALRRNWLAAMSLPADLIKGFVPVSGSYDVTASPTISEYVPDPKLRAEASPLLNIDAPPPAAVIGVGSVERQLAPSRALAEKLQEKGGRVQLVVLDGMEHHETALAVGDDKSQLFQAILHMISGK